MSPRNLQHFQLHFVNQFRFLCILIQRGSNPDDNHGLFDDMFDHHDDDLHFDNFNATDTGHTTDEGTVEE